jgi:hypothetical protein
MAAKRNFHCGRKPADLEPVFGGSMYNESRLREVHLRSNVPQQPVFGKLVKKTDGGWVAAKGFRGKSVDLKKRKRVLGCFRHDGIPPL